MIKWGRSRDGFVESKCGRFAQSFELRVSGKRFGWYDTQRKAKAAAERATLTRT